jgi:hypothetical protein
MNSQSWECCQWGRVWSIWWDYSFHHLNDQAKNTIGQRSTILAQWPPWKSQEFQKTRPQRKVAQWLCNIWSMCANMTSCVKMWLVLNICVKYAKCVKIWPFVWKLDFHWIFVSMFENMVICAEILLSLNISVKYAQCVKIWLFLMCVQFPEVLCSVSGEVCAVSWSLLFSFC